MTDEKNNNHDPVEEEDEELLEKKEKRLVTGRAGRMAKLGTLSGKMGANYFGAKLRGVFSDQEHRDKAIKDTHLGNVKLVVDTLGEMKGAVMKVGQMLSLQADLLPPELADILADLQKKAPPVKFDVIRNQLREEWGQDYQDVLGTMDRRPIASASIGQVHKAMLKDGTRVVVKVRYPGVAEAVDSDLDNLKTIASTLGKAMSKADIVPLFEELRERLVEELDYGHELKNIELFREAYKDHKNVVIPKPYPEYCRPGVLVMSREEGDDGPSLLNGGASQERLNKLAALWIDALFDQFFNKRMIHADPNLGNFAFRGNDTIVLYDFGCVKRLDKSFTEQAKIVIREALKGDYDSMMASVEKLGLSYLGKDPLPPDMIEEFTEAILYPYRSEQPYTLGSAPLHEWLQKLAFKYYKEAMNFQPPKDIIFINRTVAGLYGTLTRWRAQISVTDLLDRYLFS